MPQYGSGVIPSAGSVASELTAVTRRGFIEKTIVQIYNASPLIAAMIANSNTAYGGVSSITQPVQGTPMVTPAWSDYSGSFNAPNTIPGLSDAEFNLKLMITPIPFLGMEGIVQLDHAVIPLIEARMNDAGNTTVDAMATALYNNYTNTQAFIGLPGAVDDSTNLTTYGGISRSSNTWWKSKVYTASANPTRQLILQYIVGTVKNGAEMPSFGVCGPGTWTLLAQDFVGQETYQITPGSAFTHSPDGPESAFSALSIAGVPIYMDPYCPEGTMYLLNTNYCSLYIHEGAAFALKPFESMLPNMQLGYISALVTVAELVVNKPKAMTRIGSLNSITL